MQPEPDARNAQALRPSVAAVIRNGDADVLLQRRSDNGLWAVPGGAVEVGESVSAAIAREVRKETGLTVENERLVGVYSDPMLQIVRYADGNVVRYLIMLFACRIMGGRSAPAREVSTSNSLTPRDFPTTW